MIEVWVYTSATWKNQSKTESVGMWRETIKELNPSWDVSQKKNLATHMVNTNRRPKYGCSRCEETEMQMGKWTTVSWKTHLGWADTVFLACQTYLYLSMCPPHHQLLRQSQLAIETLDGLFTSGKETENFLLSASLRKLLIHSFIHSQYLLSTFFMPGSRKRVVS